MNEVVQQMESTLSEAEQNARAWEHDDPKYGRYSQEHRQEQATRLRSNAQQRVQDIAREAQEDAADRVSRAEKRLLEARRKAATDEDPARVLVAQKRVSTLVETAKQVSEIQAALTCAIDLGDSYWISALGEAMPLLLQRAERPGDLLAQQQEQRAIRTLAAKLPDVVAEHEPSALRVARRELADATEAQRSLAAGLDGWEWRQGLQRRLTTTVGAELPR